MNVSSSGPLIKQISFSVSSNSHLVDYISAHIHFDLERYLLNINDISVPQRDVTHQYNVEIFIAQLTFMYSPQVYRIKVSFFYPSSIHVWQ